MVGVLGLDDLYQFSFKYPFTNFCIVLPMQDLTQYNTAHNRQISMVGIQENQRSRKRKSTSSISFAEEEEIINMEDVDPSVESSETWSPPLSYPR